MKLNKKNYGLKQGAIHKKISNLFSVSNTFAWCCTLVMNKLALYSIIGDYFYTNVLLYYL